MQVALRELKEVGRIAYPIAAQAFSAQQRIFERDGQRGMIRALGSAFPAGAELSTFDRAQAALGLLRKQLGPSLQALAPRHARDRVYVGLARNLL
jgi:hypothetical protein